MTGSSWLTFIALSVNIDLPPPWSCACWTMIELEYASLKYCSIHHLKSFMVKATFSVLVVHWCAIPLNRLGLLEILTLVFEVVRSAVTDQDQMIIIWRGFATATTETRCLGCFGKICCHKFY
jgi:hypothetical protein